MVKSDISNAELGNLIFGNSHGEYKVEPRMEYQDVFWMARIDVWSVDNVLTQK